MDDNQRDLSADFEASAGSESSGLGSRAISRGLATLLLIAFATTFALQNSETVEVTFLAWDFSMSKILLMIASAVVGILLWLLISRLLRRNKSK
jgi:uncharacterized integral membrane protein